MLLGAAKHVDCLVVVQSRGAFLEIASSKHTNNGVTDVNAKVGSLIGDLGKHYQAAMVTHVVGMGKLSQLQSQRVVAWNQVDAGADVFNTVKRVLGLKSVHACGGKQRTWNDESTKEITSEKKKNI